MITTRFLAEHQTQMPWGEWVPALPESMGLRWRLRDAWAVLRGRAEAVCLPVAPPEFYTHSHYRWRAASPPHEGTPDAQS